MNNKIIDQKAIELINSKSASLQEKLKNIDYLNQYLVETLESFAYRYFDDPLSVEQVSKNILRVVTVEKGIKEAIKIKNTQLRLGITDLVKRISKDQGPTILKEIKINCEKDSAHSGTVEVFARISFGHPEHDFKAGTFVEKTSLFNFQDELELRNTFAKHLEIVCEIFC